LGELWGLGLLREENNCQKFIGTVSDFRDFWKVFFRKSLKFLPLNPSSSSLEKKQKREIFAPHILRFN
jgi:hypothetical protein